jgi:DNA-binding transcriptional regulator YiaG
VHRTAEEKVAALKADNKSLKQEIAALKKSGAGLKATAGHACTAVSEDEIKTSRFTPKIIIRLRKKFGLSRLKMAKLLGINNKSIARWEEGIGEPKSNSKTKLIALRKMTKRDIKKHLQDLKATAKTEKTVAKKTVKKAVAKKAPKKAVKKVAKKATAPAASAANN